MFRLRRTIGWLFLVVVAIFLVSLLGANLYVQSQATQERIQQELSQRLKMPLQIQRISVTPWGGLKLSGITIPQKQQCPRSAVSSSQGLSTSRPFGFDFLAPAGD